MKRQSCERAEAQRLEAHPTGQNIVSLHHMVGGRALFTDTTFHDGETYFSPNTMPKISVFSSR